jgi:hypothetical protein
VLLSLRPETRWHTECELDSLTSPGKSYLARAPMRPASLALENPFSRPMAAGTEFVIILDSHFSCYLLAPLSMLWLLHRHASEDLHGHRRLRRHVQGDARLFDAAHDPAGVVPETWQQVLLEWQRDWARKETYEAVMAFVREDSGAYGTGVDEGPRGFAARGGIIRPTRLSRDAHLLLSLGANFLVGVVYSLLNVQSPARPWGHWWGCSAN